LKGQGGTTKTEEKYPVEKEERVMSSGGPLKRFKSRYGGLQKWRKDSKVALISAVRGRKSLSWGDGKKDENKSDLGLRRVWRRREAKVLQGKQIPPGRKTPQCQG